MVGTVFMIHAANAIANTGKKTEQKTPETTVASPFPPGLVMTTKTPIGVRTWT